MFTALQNGDIDAYPEYTGTGWSIHLKIAEPVRDPLRAYLVVADEFEKRFDVTWLRPFGFSNSYALAMDEGRAKELGIRTISDLKSHEQELRAGVSHEFPQPTRRLSGLAGKAYGLHISTCPEWSTAWPTRRFAVTASTSSIPGPRTASSCATRSAFSRTTGTSSRPTTAHRSFAPTPSSATRSSGSS
ncbi:MAG: hypothetical protein H6717_09420 [Polyangiaceae bacterium]|nr:hypothetical protein [Polyangiaceae bacterium]